MKEYEFTKERPQIPGYEHAGPEPSLEQLVEGYYWDYLDDSFTAEQINELVTVYFLKLFEKYRIIDR